MRLKGRNALITGAGSGIGKATARLFAQEGANVAVNDLSPERCAETIKELSAFGVKTISVPADVTDQSAVEKMTHKVIGEFGRLDTLVSNAGVAPSVELADMTTEQWDRMIKIHLYGLYYCARAVVNHMIANKFGRILVTSSTSGIQGDVSLVHYSAAKAGQIGFVKALSREVVDKGITVNVVAPGLTRTAIQADVDERVIQRYIAPIGRWGVPEDQAWAFVYLASDEAEYVTGQVISPNGGAL